MFRNFITDTDLQVYHPTLKKQLWSGQASYQTQINEAFDRVNNDLFNENVNPRLVMTPIDLKRTSVQTGHIQLIMSTESVSTTGTSMSAGQGFRRLVTNVNAVNDPWTIQIQGSNANTPTDWANVSNASITASNAGEYNSLFSDEFAWYRYVSNPSGTGSVTYSVSLVETIFDKLIIYKTFQLIFTDFVRTTGDQNEILKRDYINAYNNLIQHLKYSYDVDDSGTIGVDEEISFKDTYFVR
jgi:hypothetical protein